MNPEVVLTLYASMIMAIAAAPIILSPKGTMGTQARRRAVAQPDSSARGRTYAAFIQPEPMSGS